MEKRPQRIMPSLGPEADKLAGLMEASAHAYHQAWVTLEKCKTDLKKTYSSMARVRKFSLGCLSESYEHYWFSSADETTSTISEGDCKRPARRRAQRD